MISAPFHFDRDDHVYTEPSTGRRIMNITSLLTVSGEVDERWYTEEGGDRGRDVAELTAQFDMGAMTIEACPAVYRGYLSAWALAMQIVRPQWDHIETPVVHPQVKLGGCPDRTGAMWRRKSVVEVKTGAVIDAYGVQLALQAILMAPTYRLPAHAIARFGIFVKADGRFAVHEFKLRGDFRRAEELIGRYCR